MLTYVVTIQISGGTPIQFLAREADIGSPNRNKRWAHTVCRKLQSYQIREGQLNHDLTRVDLKILEKESDGQGLSLLGGTQSSSPMKIFELLPAQLCLPI